MIEALKIFLIDVVLMCIFMGVLQLLIILFPIFSREKK